jgi:hypothetical protein
MNYTDDLHRVVGELLKSGRIGEPVFVRCTAGVAGDDDDHRRTLLNVAAAVCSWVMDPAERVSAIVSSPSGATSLVIEFRRGGTALVATTTEAAPGPAADLVILGNRGAAYHEGLIAGIGPFAAPGGTRPTEQLRSAIERAIASGQPVAVGTEGAP